MHGVDRGAHLLVRQGEEPSHATSQPLRQVQPQRLNQHHVGKLLCDQKAARLRLAQLLASTCIRPSPSGDSPTMVTASPTGQCSSYLWRNIMPHCEGLGRLIACDLIGMGRSDKLPDSGPERYSYHEQRDYLFALWEQLNLGDKVIVVLHDWGSLLGFDWTRQHPDRVQGIAYMEAIVQPITWADFPEDARSIFQGFRSNDGEMMVLEKNLFVESVLPGATLRKLSDEEMAAYRAPFVNAGEDRRPTLTWPRQIPIEGEPPEVGRVATDCGRWLAES